jgi:hypothetical protein
MAKQRTKVISNASLASAGMAPSVPLQAQSFVDSSAIAALAYQLWQARGCPAGSPEADWFQAEQKLCGPSVKPKSLAAKRPLLARQAGA